MGIELSVIWFVIIVFATLMYIVMDGFDLGIGILFGTVEGSTERDVMVNSVAPVWDCLLYTSGIDVPLPGRQLAGRLTEDPDGAAGELLKTGNQPQAGGFPRARRTQHREKLAVTDANADPVHCPYIAIPVSYTHLTPTFFDITSFLVFLP